MFHVPLLLALIGIHFTDAKRLKNQINSGDGQDFTRSHRMHLKHFQTLEIFQTLSGGATTLTDKTWDR